MTLPIALAAFLAAQTAAPPPDWRELGRHQSGATLSYDRASIRPGAGGAPARVNVRTMLPNGRYAISLIEIRCAANEARVSSTQNYRADGSLDARDDVPVAFAAIPAGSPVATIRANACPG